MRMNFSASRPCSPSLFSRRKTSSIIRWLFDQGAGQGDVLTALLAHRLIKAVEVLALLLAGQLDHHRQIDPGDDFYLVLLQKGEGDVRRGAAEHIRQDQNALTLIGRPYRLFQFVVHLINLVVPSDRYRDNMLADLSDNH